MVAAFVIIECGIGDICAVGRCNDIFNKCRFRYSAHAFETAPVQPIIFGYRNHTIVGSDIDKAFGKRALAESDGGPENRRRIIFRDRIDAPYPSHDFERVSVNLATKVRTDLLP
ncbi:MAG: Uncharacterised protein [Hyphomonas sp. TMED17]|nr:MAG: Uncharacterised protein [Hyphomonas sp. TMED17]